MYSGAQMGPTLIYYGFVMELLTAFLHQMNTSAFALLLGLTTTKQTIVKKL